MRGANSAASFSDWCLWVDKSLGRMRDLKEKYARGEKGRHNQASPESQGAAGRYNCLIRQRIRTEEEKKGCLRYKISTWGADTTCVKRARAHVKKRCGQAALTEKEREGVGDKKKGGGGGPG